MTTQKANCIARYLLGALLLPLTLAANASPSDEALEKAIEASTRPSDHLVSPEEAFSANVQQNGQNIIINFKVADGYYLYRDKIRFKSHGKEVGQPEFSRGEVKSDQFFGRQVIYKHQASAYIPISDMAPQTFEVEVTYQGCAEVGVCYPPQTKKFIAHGRPTRDGKKSFVPPSLAETQIPRHQKQKENDATEPRASKETAIATISPIQHTQVTATLSPPQTPTEPPSLTLSRNKWLQTIGGFFLAGLATAFTACLYPLLPVHSSIITGQGVINRRKGIFLSISYVQGLSLTYTTIGVVAGLTGSLLSVWLQQPAVILTTAVLMVIFALSMFDLFSIQLPSALQTQAATASAKLPGGKYVSVFGMGALSALVIGPCVAPPLALALGYIGRTGDATLGGLALYAMAVGIGTPLILIGAFGGHLLPRAGHWMKVVKSALGVAMLALAIRTAAPFMPAHAEMAAWAVLGIGLSVAMGAFEALPLNSSAWPKVAKSLGLIFFIAGASQVVGLMSGAEDIGAPLRPLLSTNNETQKPQNEFQPVRNVNDLEAALKRHAGRPILLDFSASWCIACKEMDEKTFTDPRIATKMGRMTLLRVDVTNNSEEGKKLMKKFGFYGPPGVVLFHPDGAERKRINGFRDPVDLLRDLQFL